MKTERVFEMATNADGVLGWAWVTYRIGDGERRCVAIEWVQSHG